MRFVLMIVLLLASADGARAQPWLDRPGATGSTVVAIGSAKVLLPPGEWLSAGDNAGTYRGESIRLVERTYLQIDHQRVASLVYIGSNASAATGRWGFRPADMCFRQDVFVNESEDVFPGQYRCLAVNHLMLTWNGQPPPLWQETIAKAAAYGGLPRPMVAAVFNMASPDRSGFVSVSVYFNPALAGFTSRDDVPWAQSEWNKNNATPDRVAYLNRVAAWARAYRSTIAAAWN